MFCVKCGKEIADGNMFCAECLADMARYPVKPGTPVQIPQRPAQTPAKAASSRKREISPEKRIRRQRRAIWVLSVLLILSLALNSLAAYLFWERLSPEIPDETIGQNYIAVETGDP